MCEPCHSIVQYPDHDDDDRSSGTPTEQRVSKMKLGEWLRKIGQWLHLSKMGEGHTEAVQKMSHQSELFLPAAQLYLPTPTLYEVNWWERTLHIDGAFRGGFNGIGRNGLARYSAENMAARRGVNQLLEQEAKKAAQQYANAVSIGSMTALRRFLTTSMEKSVMPWRYIELFKEMLNAAGQNKFLQKIGSLTMRRGRIETRNAKNATKVMMWFTRKREFLIPEWADDKRLWVPNKSVME